MTFLEFASDLVEILPYVPKGKAGLPYRLLPAHPQLT